MLIPIYYILNKYTIEFNKLCIYFRIKDYFLDLVKELLKDKNVDVVFNVIKYMKDILGPQYCVSIIT